MKDQRRSRIVTFRLSEAEYNSLKSACGLNRNTVSAAARVAVLEWADALSLPKLDGRLADIDIKLDKLVDLLTKNAEENA
ncbi:MAG TPA: hypothetical protein VGF59_11585 [Bryobacteraceae bacterium]